MTRVAVIQELGIVFGDLGGKVWESDVMVWGWDNLVQI